MNTQETFSQGVESRQNSRPDYPLRCCLGGMLLLGGCVLIGAWVFQRPIDFERWRMSENNLQQISLALTHYQGTHGTFPPIYIPDENGKPMHSWRVLILRELERKDLHALYDFDLPWDHPKNLEVASYFPYVFASPYFHEHDEEGLTTYLAVSAEGTGLGASKPSGAEVADRRILVIEAFDKPVPWTKPVDISPDEILASLKRMKENGGRGFHVLLADGSIRRVNPEHLREERIYIVDDELFLRGAK